MQASVAGWCDSPGLTRGCSAKGEFVLPPEVGIPVGMFSNNQYSSLQALPFTPRF